MPKKTTTFVEDIVIHTNDGKTKLLTKAALKKLPSVGEDFETRRGYPPAARCRRCCNSVEPGSGGILLPAQPQEHLSPGRR
ncbi:MAG: hypothetical protein QM784_21390 [Polyangiaceae bacterium]